MALLFGPYPATVPLHVPGAFPGQESTMHNCNTVKSLASGPRMHSM